MSFRHIDIETTTVSVFEIIKWIQRDDLDIYWYEIPDREKWSKKQMSILIESIILGIPIAGFYISEEQIYSYIVLDGKKRLNALYKFLNNEIKLVGLNLLPEFNECSFDDLPIYIQRKIYDSEFTLYIVRRFCEPMIKTQILHRVNSKWFIDLKVQALRNRIFESQMHMINELIDQSRLYRRVKRNNLEKNHKIDRLLLQEHILRLMALYFDSNDTSDFTTIDKILNDMDSLNFDRFKKEFERVTRNMEYGLSDYPFLFRGLKKTLLLLEVIFYCFMGWENSFVEENEERIYNAIDKWVQNQHFLNSPFYMSHMSINNYRKWATQINSLLERE